MRRIGLLALGTVAVLVWALAQRERPVRSSGSDGRASATPEKPAPIPTAAPPEPLPPGMVELRGTIVTEERRAVEEAAIVLRDVDGGVRRTTSGAGGRFALRVARGSRALMHARGAEG